jgi:endo-1,4-beta-xylanase
VGCHRAATQQLPLRRADQIVSHAQAHTQRLRGHTRVWHSQLPAWVSSIGDANRLRSVMTNHINTLMARYRGQIYAWDVVNEAFADGSSGQLRSSVFRNVLGTGFLEEAFRAARAAATTCGTRGRPWCPGRRRAGRRTRPRSR